MAEDAEISKRRHEQQQLRRQLHEVFGPFDQFCEYVAGTTSAGSAGIMRHGVVQVKSMQNLVTSPIQPLQGLPFSCNREYMHTAPSSSTHSAPDAADSPAKKGKRHRAMDSDSEVERDKRRRRNEEVREPPDKGISPDSGVHSAENDPGDENDVHSAQTIINSLTKLSPPLSPIKQRPTDKKAERERKEMEAKERERRAREKEEAERAETQRKEREERERHEREQAEREERMKNERIEQERKEREREEKQRRERDREERERREKEREEKEREEKERKEKEYEEKVLREKEMEEKLRKEREQEERTRREKEREARRKSEKERHSADKKMKVIKDERKERNSERGEKSKNGDSTERQKQVEVERLPSDHSSRTDVYRGEIPLKGLGRSKLNQLIEIGKRTGRMKQEDRKENRKEERVEKQRDGSGEKRKEKKEKEKKSKDKLKVEDIDALRRERMSSSAKSSPCMPRASSSQSHDSGDHGHTHRPSSVVGNHPCRGGFECAASECTPSKPSRPVKPEEGSTEKLFDFYHAIGRSRKRKADAEPDKVIKILLYLDTSMYFILSAKHLTSPESPEMRGNRQYSIVRDTNDLLKRVTQTFSQQPEGCPPLIIHMSSRIRNLSWRCQSCLLYHMYNLRSQNAIKSYSILSQMDSQIQEEHQQQQNGGAAQNSSSPGSSVHSNSNQSTTFVSMPSRLYDIQKTQLKTLHNLMWSHKVWDDARKRAEACAIDLAFIATLEKMCGPMYLDAPLEKMCAYVLTGITWLRAEYELEKNRPPPSLPKRTGGA
ncbi:unnamed protein product [Nippostrongylus brasiliensis]|uniref:AF4/FMR2 family member lilli n=1 Tax=Nippostrongylus brasiliensis TaxID=27835 RepID=A0A0N4YDU2_NIPBR|nr:unnamed protein product [Nippostrongylus brasiliensis]